MTKAVYNPWFKNLFTGELFLLDTYTRFYDDKDVIGAILIGRDSLNTKRQFTINLPNNSKVKFSVHFSETESAEI